MAKAPTARERVRTELTAEIKRAAGEELAAGGAAGLSLRAVARRVGMVPSALYRYFDGRDALLTALIIDAYDDLGRAAEHADSAAPASRPAVRWLAVGRAVRAWAIERPHQWALVYGSPVPGYAAPADTIPSAMRLVVVLVGILAQRDPATPLPLRPRIGRELRAWLRTVREPYLSGLPDDVTAMAMVAYIQLLGSVSLELFGQYGEAASPAPGIFEYGLLTSTRLLGLDGG